jgi:hypothetical protein
LAIFDISDFKRETILLQNNLKNFVTQDFRYELTPRSIRRYITQTSGISLLFSITIIILFLIRKNSINPIVLSFIGLMIFFIGGGLNLILFFNYYIYLRDKLVIMSKGNDVFYFGDTLNPIEYNKKDILRYGEIASRGRRNPINGFVIIEIELKNGTILKIPNLLIDESDLEKKLSDQRKIEISRFPTLRK